MTKDNEIVLDFSVESDKPIPTNIEEMASDILSVTSVAIIARGSMGSAEDADMILKAIFLYTDAKDYDRHLVAQIISQYVNTMPIEDAEENGN
jgi:hypothetical protein